MVTQRRVVVALVALAVAVAGCSLVGEAEIETTAAAATVDGIIAEAEEATTVDGFVELDQCPFDPGGGLLAEALGGLSDNQDVIAAQAGELMGGVSEADPSIPVVVACDRFQEESGTGLVVTPAPADFDRYLEIFNQGINEEPPLIDRRGSTDHRGGTLHRVCVETPDPPDGVSYCEVDWLDENLLVTVYVAGPTSLDIDLELLEAGLVAVLDDVVANLGDADTDG